MSWRHGLVEWGMCDLSGCLWFERIFVLFDLFILPYSFVPLLDVCQHKARPIHSKIHGLDIILLVCLGTGHLILHETDVIIKQTSAPPHRSPHPASCCSFFFTAGHGCFHVFPFIDLWCTLRPGPFGFKGIYYWTHSEGETLAAARKHCSGGFKSCLWKVLKNAKSKRGDKTTVVDFSPKAISTNELTLGTVFIFL